MLNFAALVFSGTASRLCIFGIHNETQDCHSRDFTEMEAFHRHLILVSGGKKEEKDILLTILGAVVALIVGDREVEKRTVFVTDKSWKVGGEEPEHC